MDQVTDYRELRHSIGEQPAVALSKTKWWEGKTDFEIAHMQMFTVELCCPFDVFHKAIEGALGRPVWTHEFGMNWNGIAEELIAGGEPPTVQEIIEMIPEEKRIVIT